MALRSKYSGNPLLLASSGLLFASGFYLAFKHFYKPYAKRMHYMRQEELIQPLLISRNLVDHQDKKND